jgi:hypothetical protein
MVLIQDDSQRLTGDICTVFSFLLSFHSQSLSLSLSILRVNSPSDPLVIRNCQQSGGRTEPHFRQPFPMHSRATYENSYTLRM